MRDSALVRPDCGDGATDGDSCDVERLKGLVPLLGDMVLVIMLATGAAG